MKEVAWLCVTRKGAIYRRPEITPKEGYCTYNLITIQLNFPITDNLGAGILSFIVRSSIFGS